MKNLSIISRQLLIALLVYSVVIPKLSHATTPQTQRNILLQERQMKAAEQLRVYQSRIASSKNKIIGATVTSAPAYLGIRINKNIQTSSTIFFYDNMESGTNGWSDDACVGGGCIPELEFWHQTTRDASSPTHSWWQGIESQGNYRTGSRVNTALISPLVNLSGAVGSIKLIFAENYFTEYRWDRCMVDVSTDSGNTWTHLRGGYGSAPSGDSRGWLISSLDLTPYANQTINIRFYFDTGDSVANYFPGWFVDDVVIFDQGGTISGYKFADDNGNGSWEPQQSEVGLNGWFVRITGPITLSMITRTNDVSPGSYQVALPQGNYSISESLRTGWTQTYPPGSSWNVALNTADTTIGDLNFGNQGPLTIVRGMKFNDLNHDGVKDSLEQGIPNWEIHIEPTEDGVDPTTTTDSLGNYVFYVTTPNNYSLWESQELFWQQSSSPSVWRITTTEVGGLIENIDFGNYYISHSVSIAGMKFDDANRNGVRDNNERGIANWGIHIGGPDITTFTDSNGYYRVDSLEPGDYVIREILQDGWWQSYPPAKKWTLLLDSNTFRDSLDFGNYVINPSTIRGVVFNDVNRNNMRDSGEVLLAGWNVTLNGGAQTAITDSNGLYQFTGLWPESYTLNLESRQGWWRSESNRIVNLLPEETRDSIDLGTYEIVTGSISGRVFRDINSNGIRDSAETPLAGWQLFLSGGSSSSTTTNDSGLFTFNGLWPGTYNVSEDSRDKWSQTSPLPSRSYDILLGPEENRMGADFGNVESKFLPTYYRTFIPESLALAVDKAGKHKSIKPKPDKVLFTFRLGDTLHASSVNQLRILFAVPLNRTTLKVSPAITETTTTDNKSLVFTFASPLNSGDSVTIEAFGIKPKKQSARFFFMNGGSPKEPKRRDFREIKNELGYPMPNAYNLIEKTGYNLKVGIGGAHSVLHVKPSDVLKSLYERGHLHTGESRCLNKFTNGRLIKKLQKTLPPSKHNNKLFAEAVALNLNIASSDLFVLPLGFKNLVYNDTTDTASPFNEKPIRTIAAMLDTFMSSHNDTIMQCVTPSSFQNMTAENLYSVIRKINMAFSGPLDTVSFANGILRLTGVRDIADVPFLHVDTSEVQPVFSQIPPSSQTNMPTEFTLHQNYPNPFNPTTTLSFVITQSSLVTLKVYNVLGQEVTTLFNREQMDEGLQDIEFNASSLPSGVYFYRIKAEEIIDEENGTLGKIHVDVKKMLLIK